MAGWTKKQRDEAINEAIADGKIREEDRATLEASWATDPAQTRLTLATLEPTFYPDEWFPERHRAASGVVTMGDV